MPIYKGFDVHIYISKDDTWEYLARFSWTKREGDHEIDTTSQFVTIDGVQVKFKTAQEAQEGAEQAARGVIDNR